MKLLRSPLRVILMLILGWTAAACVASAEPSPPAAAGAMRATASPTAALSQPTATPYPSPTPSPTPFYIEAHVWTEEPRVPVLLWHQFAADRAKKSTYMKTRFSDFSAELDALNQAGFTLVDVEDWLNGRIDVPPGRHPLVITMDDLFFNNQIRLDENGNPRTDSGLGIAWYYAQDHPEFGFHYALFDNLGDKYYGDGDAAGTWQDELGGTIAWCQEHNAKVYNHTYMHVILSDMNGPEITWQLEMNDSYLRQLLTRAGREDLIPSLGNMLAIPFGKWPSAGGVKVIENYQTPEGKPMQAIFDVDFIIRAQYMPSPYAPEFDRFRIPRINADPQAVDYLATHADEFPVTQACQIQLSEPTLAQNTEALIDAISESIATGRCPRGLYIFDERVFDARQDPVTMLAAPSLGE